MARKKKDETEVADGTVELTEEEAKDFSFENTDTEADALEAAIDAAEDEIGEYSAEDYGGDVEPVEAMADHEAEVSREMVYKKALHDVLRLTSGTLDHRFVNINRVASEALRGG
ncbi:MAG: hypothetical protein ACXABY_31740 [Candidatus Thorarchaeota archaeon]|jgi:hypothetical protein